MLEEQIITLSILLLKKYKIEKKLRQTFKCFLRKCFSCCGMRNIEDELKHLTEQIDLLRATQLDNKKLKTFKSSSI